MTGKLYRDGLYSLRASLHRYKTVDMGGIPRVGGKGWMSKIEIVMERIEVRHDK